MTIQEMKDKIRQSCFEMLLNSNVEDWIDYKYTKNNIVFIIKNQGEFEVNIYTDNFHTLRCETIYFQDLFLLICNKKEKEEIRKMRKKYREISEYLKNKKEYDRVTTTYNLLPIKEIRKDKLNKIND